MKAIINFGRNVEFQPAAIYRPDTVAEVLEILNRHHGQEIRAIGSLHAWSRAPETSGVMLELKNLTSVVVHRDGPSPSVTVGAGCQLKQLIKVLAAHGLAMPSLGAIDKQTLSGATATGTHGSGKHSLSHYVESVSIAHYDQQTGQAKLSVVDTGQDLKAARCSLGLMGVIVSLTLRCRQQYRIEEHAEVHATLAAVLAKEADFPLQQFYMMPWSWRYFAHHRVETKAPASRWARLYRAYCLCVVDVGLHVIIFILAKLLRLAWPIRFFYKRILPLTIIRNWKVIDDSSAILTMEHDLFRHIEIEIFVRRSRLAETTQFLIDVVSVFGGQQPEHWKTTESLLKQIGRAEELERHRGKYVHHYPITYRRVLSDETLISMASPRDQDDEDWYAISFISYQWPADRNGFLAFANFIGPTLGQLFGGRCHWGKYQPLDREMIQALYPAYGEFRECTERFDPDGAFQNAWFRELF